MARIILAVDPWSDSNPQLSEMLAIALDSNYEQQILLRYVWNFMTHKEQEQFLGAEDTTDEMKEELFTSMDLNNRIKLLAIDE